MAAIGLRLRAWLRNLSPSPEKRLRSTETAPRVAATNLPDPLSSQKPLRTKQANRGLTTGGQTSLAAKLESHDVKPEGVSMKAVEFREYGGPEVLQLVDLPDPHPGPGQIRVAVRAVGVNPVDYKMRAGTMPGELPQTTGREVAGVVDEIGAGVTDAASGDTVFGFAAARQWLLIPLHHRAVGIRLRGREIRGIGVGELY